MKNEQQRKNRQKTLILTLAIACSLVFIGVLLSGPSVAALAPTASVSPSSTPDVAPGQTNVCVQVYMNSNGVAVRTAGFKLSYPTSFTLTSFTSYKLVGSSAFEIPPIVPSNSGLVDYAQSIGTGQAINGNIATLCFTAPSTLGTYTLGLDANMIDNSGTQLVVVSTGGTITVTSGTAPLAAQCPGSKSGIVGSSVSFTGDATGGTGTYTYQWDFDYTGSFTVDATGKTVSHTYTVADTYTVALRVNDGSTTDMCTTTATITPPVTIPPPYVQVYPAADTIQPNATFCMDILVNSDTQLVRTVGVQITYNDTWFTYHSHTYADLLGASVLQVGGDNGAGLIDYGVSRQPGNTAAAVNGNLVTICFTVNPGAPKGVDFPFTIQAVNMLDQDGIAISDITLVNGTRTIPSCENDPDVNDDGSVNVLDMILVGQHWGQTGDPGWIPEDINCDGQIDVLDMILIGQNWTG